MSGFLVCVLIKVQACYGGMSLIAFIYSVLFTYPLFSCGCWGRLYWPTILGFLMGQVVLDYYSWISDGAGCIDSLFLDF